MTLPIPENEEARIARLRSYDILDTESELQFDELTALAAQICDVPIASVSLIDVNRQWFKSKVGLEIPETPRSVSFCQYTIMTEEILEVSDATKDERFLNNPFVATDPNLRFYAGVPLADEEGLIIGTLCVIGFEPKSLNKDQLTAIKAIGQTIMRLIQLRKVNADQVKYKKFFDYSLDMLCIAGTDGYFKQLNPAFSKTLGWTEEELLKKPFLDIVHPDDVEQTLQVIDSLSHGQSLVDFENRYLSKHDGYFRLKWTCYPDVNTGELFAVAHNITELRNANEMAMQSVQAKDRFLANMSHEIRTPLNAIIGFTGLLGEKKMEGENKEYLDAISLASKNLLMLINDILDISKIESGKIDLERKAFDVKGIIEDVMSINSQAAKSKGLKLLSSIDHDIPKAVVGDPARLLQILINLVGNAIKFTETGTIELRCFLEKMVDDTVQLKFCVKDTGIGIHHDKHDLIFERFTQAENSTTREYGGTGLGLSIVQMLVELQNGSIDVQSEVGKGTEFSFVLEYSVAKTEETNNVIENNSDTVNLEGIRVLIAEDNPHNQVLASTYIKRHNGICEIVENGELAVEAMKKNTYDCILMDLQMPKMDGFRATEIIRQQLQSTLPIIACTAHSLVGEKTKSMEVGMNEYITKPYLEKELISTIYAFVKGNRKDSTFHRSSSDVDDFKKILADYALEEGDEFVDSLIEIFVDRIPEDLFILQTAVSAKDSKSIAMKAHMFKGSFGSLRFDVGYQLAKELESACEDGFNVKVAQLTEELIQYLKSASSVLKE